MMFSDAEGIQADFISKFDAFDKVKNALRRADFIVCGSRSKAINADLYGSTLRRSAKVYCLVLSIHDRFGTKKGPHQSLIGFDFS